jgi:hypothetical protein
MPRGRSASLGWMEARARSLRWATSLALGFMGCAPAEPASLVLRLDSELVIGQETNSLVVRVRADDGVPEEASYPLGEGVRAAWPQTLPIVAGARHPELVALALELRFASPGVPSVVVGYSEFTHRFPAAQSEEVTVHIARACTDADDDGYGVGFGCDKPDCDDADPDVPVLRFCGAPPEPDAGVRDAGPAEDAGPGPDATPDAGVEGDGGEGRDGGPTSEDAGPPDTGVAEDAGLQDAGPALCAGEVCEADEVCFMDRCRQTCMSNRDCDGVQLACLESYGVCICRVPCRDSNVCGPFQCIEGCCQLPF